MSSATVPTGGSTDTYGALELRDSDLDAPFGKGVDKAVATVKKKMSSAIIGMNAADYSAVDAETTGFDGTEDEF